MKFENKTVWITGASSGIGEQMAYAFAKEGASLILSARRENALLSVKNNCINPEKVHVLTLDLVNQDVMPDKVNQALSMTGQIDVLVNNGGVSQRAKVQETDMSVYRKLMEVNYFGTIALTKALLPHFIQRKTGQIVVISSLMGKFSSPLRTGYAAAKHALHGFFEGLRAEHHDDGLCVTMVCPGFIATNVSMNALDGQGEKRHIMDEKTAKGIAPDVCARKIVNATSRQKQEVYIGRSEILAIYIKRFFPSLLSRIIRKAAVK